MFSLYELGEILLVYKYNLKLPIKKLFPIQMSLFTKIFGGKKEKDKKEETKKEETKKIDVSPEPKKELKKEENVPQPEIKSAEKEVKKVEEKKQEVSKQQETKTVKKEEIIEDSKEEFEEDLDSSSLSKKTKLDDATPVFNEDSTPVFNESTPIYNEGIDEGFVEEGEEFEVEENDGFGFKDVVQKEKEFESMDVNKLVEKQQNEVLNISQTLDVPVSVAGALLRAYRWKKEK